MTTLNYPYLRALHITTRGYINPVHYPWTILNESLKGVFTATCNHTKCFVKSLVGHGKSMLQLKNMHFTRFVALFECIKYA